MAESLGTDQTENTDGAADSAPTAVERLIERFGGIRPMADKLGVPVSTVQGWKKRAAIPGGRMPELRAAAARHNIMVEEADLEGVFRFDDRSHVDGGEADAADAAPQAAAPAPVEVAVAPAEAAPAPAPASAPVVPIPAAPAQASSAPEAAAPQPAAVPEPPSRPAPSVFADAPTPVSGLAHAYTHGITGAPVASAATRSGGGRGIAVFAVLLAIAGTGAALTAPLWSPDSLRRAIQIDTMEDRVVALEGKLGTTAGAGAALADRVSALEAAVKAVDAKLQAVLPVAMSLAVKDLREAMAAGRPFQTELAIVRAAGFTDAATATGLEALAPLARTGIPTRSTVEERFAFSVPLMVGADLGSVGGAIGHRLWRLVNEVADVLRVPVSAGVPVEDPNNTAALVARAGAMMEQGDLAIAVDLVGGLQGAAAEAAEPWLRDARARLTADLIDAHLEKQTAALIP